MFLHFGKRVAVIGMIVIGQSACGTAVPELTEVWDRGDPDATKQMEIQIKNAVYCELRRGVKAVRERYVPFRSFAHKEVTSADDQFLPDSWGAQATLMFTVDETSKFQPGLSLKTPIHPAVTNFRGEYVGATGLLSAFTFGPFTTAQSYAFGLGGQLSSQATRQDKLNFFYTFADLSTSYSKHDSCEEPGDLGPKSTSSPFLVVSQLGIEKWLDDAAVVTNYLRSSRAAENGEGKALGNVGSFVADSNTYDIKFIVVSSANATPTWNLVRLSANANAPFFDANRTRTHELIVTIGPNEIKTEKKHGVTVVKSLGPSLGAVNSHFSSQLSSEIGNAVAGALRSQ